MGREIDLNIIVLDVEKNIQLNVNEDHKLNDISGFLKNMFPGTDIPNFKYKENDDPKENPLPGETSIRDLVRGNDPELTLFVYTDRKIKKDDVCCIIY